ncbi:MAG: hypothetical protein JNK05_05305 [Myxococcales bacterium]|nr:hypothetical protein [Myxococcales bacterium]
MAATAFAEGAYGQSTPPTFAASSAQIHRAICRTHARCTVESVLAAGTNARGASLAVVRVRTGRPQCAGERAYRDWLVVLDRGRVRAERELVRGDSPCLEWQRSRWALESGQLVFRYGGMGAPYDPGPLGADRAVHFTTAPFAMVGRFAGRTRIADAPVRRSHGPLFWLSVEHEDELH